MIYCPGMPTTIFAQSPRMGETGQGFVSSAGMWVDRLQEQVFDIRHKRLCLATCTSMNAYL